MTPRTRDIAGERLVSQRLSGPTLDSPPQVVDWLVAVQSQDFAGAKWAVGMRMASAVERDVERAFDSGSILRTHVLRPTWHFVTPADIRWLLHLTGPRVHAVNGSMYRRLELDSDTLKRAKNALVQALAGGRHLTRGELRKALEDAGLTAGDGLRMAYIVMAAELDALLCSGPRRGKQFTYALLDERAPATSTLRRDEALAELSRRYFMSRGPATEHDFAKWSGLTVSDARRGVDAACGHIERTVVDGRTLWHGPSAEPQHRTDATAHLLSIYDEYISGYKDRADIGEAAVGARLTALGNALQFVVVVNGQVVGTWRRTLRRDAVAIELSLLTGLTAAEQEAVARAAERYGRFLELPVAITKSGAPLDAPGRT